MKRRVDPTGAVKRNFASMLRTLSDDRMKYKFVRVMDSFYALPSEYQDGLVHWLHSHIGDERWEAWASDRYQYADFMRAVLMHFSGRRKVDEPCMEDFGRLVADFVTSEEFRKIIPSSTAAEVEAASEEMADALATI